MAGQQISPGIAHSLSRLCLSHLRSRLPCRYWTSKRLAFSSDVYASYVLPVRQASVLPSASFRFHLTVDTLAVRLMIPPAGVIGVLHSLASAPCRAHQNKSPCSKVRAFVRFERFLEPQLTSQAPVQRVGSDDDRQRSYLAPRDCQMHILWS